jgi:hypothetical protein
MFSNKSLVLTYVYDKNIKPALGYIFTLAEKA